MKIHLMTNNCKHPHCWELDCAENCRYFKPRLFGFIPIWRSLGAWILFKQECRFLKKYWSKHHDDNDEWDDFPF